MTSSAPASTPALFEINICIPHFIDVDSLLSPLAEIINTYYPKNLRLKLIIFDPKKNTFKNEEEVKKMHDTLLKKVLTTTNVSSALKRISEEKKAFLSGENI